MNPPCSTVLTARRAAAAVVAACREATVAQQAELTGAKVDREVDGTYRLCGPWREDPA